MTAFIVSLVILIAGYFIYGKIAERVFGDIDGSRPTPAVTQADGCLLYTSPSPRDS